MTKQSTGGEREEKLKALAIAVDEIKEKYGEGSIMKLGVIPSSQGRVSSRVFFAFIADWRFFSGS